MTWGQSKDVRREPEGTDATHPPGASDPKVALPARLMTEDEQAAASTNWTIVGGSGIVEVSPSCLSSDTRSSMEDYWRRRAVIVGGPADPGRFWENLFQGRHVGTPRADAVPIPPGWTCGPWGKPVPNVPTTPNQIVQSFDTWGRICTGPADGAGLTPAQAKAKAKRDASAAAWKAARPILRPPTPQTPRPALPVTPPPVRAMPGQRLGAGKGLRPGVPLTRKKGAQGKPVPKQSSKDAFDVDRFLEWLEGHEALAVELSMQPPDVRRAILTENPEILYVWILLGWLELDEAAASIFQTLAGELAEVGLSLFDFEEAIRAELPAALAKELTATPLGVAELIAPASTFSVPVAGEWDAASGVFLPAETSEIQRASYGYTPQAPRLTPQAPRVPQFAGRPVDRADAAAQARARREARTTIAGCSACAGEPPPRIGGVRGPNDGWQRGPSPPGSEVETRILPASAGRSAGVREWRLTGRSYGTEPGWVRGAREEREAAAAIGCGAWTNTTPPDRGTRGGFRIEFARMNRSGGHGKATTIDPRSSGSGPLPGPASWSWRSCSMSGAPVAGPIGPGTETDAPATDDEVRELACCPECAIENMGPTARAWCAGIADPAARIGDAWADFGRGFAAADRFLSDNVWENVKGIVPYGNIIDAAHQGRMRLLESAAPDFYPSRGTAAGAKGASAGKSSAKGAAAPDVATDRAITAASRLAAGVKAGDSTAIGRAKATKDAAAAGDPEARRNWRVYVLVARDEHGA